jgi:hypothetical protein
MTEHSVSPHLFNLIEASERTRGILREMSLDAFEADW